MKQSTVALLKYFMARTYWYQDLDNQRWQTLYLQVPGMTYGARAVSYNISVVIRGHPGYIPEYHQFRFTALHNPHCRCNTCFFSHPSTIHIAGETPSGTAPYLPQQTCVRSVRHRSHQTNMCRICMTQIPPD